MKSRIIFSILIITNVMFMLFAFVQNVVADEQRELAEQNAMEAQRQAVIAASNADEAQRQNLIAREQQLLAEENAAEAMRQHQRAEEAEKRCR